ncbi:hypothetical protein [Streptomyces sp. MS2.AVA.5]|uniref:Uncharacterized protein n=1 Tax=Streptomyces achmelvichensis TaxID=3134111 RepID=A0ACC6PKW3_9ACTN
MAANLRAEAEPEPTEDAAEPQTAETADEGQEQVGSDVSEETMGPSPAPAVPTQVPGETKARRRPQS